MPPERPMRVLVAGIAWPPETFVARLIEGLAQAGVQVVVATDRPPAASWRRNPLHRWVRLPAWNVPLHVRAWNIVKILPQAAMGGTWLRQEALKETTIPGVVRRCCRLAPFAANQWDVVYFPWNAAAIEFLPVFELGKPVVISCRGAQVNVAPHNPQRREIIDGLRQTFQKASAVHCVSQEILREAVQYGLDPVKARVIRPAVDPAFFHPAPARPANARFTVVTTGSLIWRKGYEDALQALRMLVDQGVDAELHIIGAGPERQRILFTVQDLGLDDRVTLHDKLPPEAVCRRLQSADAFLLSSLSEGISNAVLEAMSCGLPVVTTDCGGMREAVTDGVEGFVTPVRDPQAAAAALLRLAGDPTLREHMGAAARRRVLADFDLCRQVEDFAGLFASVRKMPS